MYHDTRRHDAVMPAEVFTSHVRYAGPDALWIGTVIRTVSADQSPFAPSPKLHSMWLDRLQDGDGRLSADDWRAFRYLYVLEMRESYAVHRAAWDELLARQRVVLLCFCQRDAENHNETRCHRRVLARDILARKLGATDGGEI
jgi:uncharacterized protein YeaO (DUF488 family)